MARIARVVIPNIPHHIVQRGNRRQKVFFGDSDKMEYLKIIKEQTARFKVSVWSYCLMDNHVHFIAVPSDSNGLSNAFGQAHRHYTRMINFREGFRGYLWQGRFSSYALDENYLYAAVRYVENNPVEAKLVGEAEDYPWSSAKARVFGLNDDLLSDYFLIKEISNWSEFLKAKHDEDPEQSLLIKHLNTGRPLGAPEFIEWMSQKLGVVLAKAKPGPKPKNRVN